MGSRAFPIGIPLCMVEALHGGGGIPHCMIEALHGGGGIPHCMVEALHSPFPFPFAWVGHGHGAPVSRTLLIPIKAGSSPLLIQSWRDQLHGEFSLFIIISILIR